MVRLKGRLAEFEALLAAGQRLYGRNLLAAGDGNLSLRLQDGTVVITPSGVCKAELKLAQLALVTLSGEVLRGHPSSETAMHLEVYRSCPQARAVVHAHPPTAVAFTIARPELEWLPDDCMSELILAAGRIPVVPYARPGTPRLGHALLPFLPEYRLLVLARHGALAWGESLSEAVNGMERLEHVAQILKAAVELGGLSSLPEEEAEALRQLRRRLGPRLL